MPYLMDEAFFVAREKRFFGNGCGIRCTDSTSETAFNRRKGYAAAHDRQ